MREEELSILRMGLVLLAVAALLPVIYPNQTSAQDAAAVCSAPTDADFDLDGLTDAEECNGLVNSGTAANANINWPGVGDSEADKESLDPTVPNLFVVLVKAAGSLIPDDPFKYLRDGLGISVLEIPEADFPGTDPRDWDRVVIERDDGSFMSAVKVIESLNTQGLALGRVDVVNPPNDCGDATVYTQRIHNHINTKCTGMVKCFDKNTGFEPTSVPSLYDLYIQHTIAHEGGHCLLLRRAYYSQYGGPHYATKDLVVMSQSVKNKLVGKNKDRRKFWVSTDYAAPDLIYREISAPP